MKADLYFTSINREYSSGIYIADESILAGCRLIHFDKLVINVKGKDVYYFNMSNGELYVFRAKYTELTGCLFVRNREEYNQVYRYAANQGYANMPENMFDRLEREYLASKA